jgi:hypothetical protein
VSFSLERKFGNPEKKFFGTYRIGIGFGTILGGNYQQSQPNQLSATPSGNSSSRKGVGNTVINLFPYELFTEFGLGLGYCINENWSFQILRNNIVGLIDLDNSGEPIIEHLKQYDFLNEAVRYRSLIFGINFKLVYHFNKQNTTKN